MDRTRIVIFSLLTGTCGGRLNAMSGALAAAHCLKRGSLLGPLIGKVQLHLKVMIVISNLTRDRARLLEGGANSHG